MTSLRSKSLLRLATLGAMLVTSTASRQWRYHQPWRLARDSHTSRVNSCDDATPNNRVAWDDWHATEEAKLVVVEWWGVLRERGRAGDARPVSPGDRLARRGELSSRRRHLRSVRAAALPVRRNRLQG